MAGAQAQFIGKTGDEQGADAMSRFMQGMQSLAQFGQFSTEQNRLNKMEEIKNKTATMLALAKSMGSGDEGVGLKVMAEDKNLNSYLKDYLGVLGYDKGMADNIIGGFAGASASSAQFADILKKNFLTSVGGEGEQQPSGEAPVEAPPSAPAQQASFTPPSAPAASPAGVPPAAASAAPRTASPTQGGTAEVWPRMSRTQGNRAESETVFPRMDRGPTEQFPMEGRGAAASAATPAPARRPTAPAAPAGKTAQPPTSPAEQGTAPAPTLSMQRATDQMEFATRAAQAAVASGAPKDQRYFENQLSKLKTANMAAAREILSDPALWKWYRQKKAADLDQSLFFASLADPVNAAKMQQDIASGKYEADISYLKAIGQAAVINANTLATTAPGEVRAKMAESAARIAEANSAVALAPSKENLAKLQYAITKLQYDEAVLYGGTDKGTLGTFAKGYADSQQNLAKFLNTITDPKTKVVKVDESNLNQINSLIDLVNESANAYTAMASPVLKKRNPNWTGPSLLPHWKIDKKGGVIGLFMHDVYTIGGEEVTSLAGPAAPTPAQSTSTPAAVPSPDQDALAADQFRRGG